MRKRIQLPEIQHEFDLDLAPLLAVMVKLVPVLLVTSSFVTLTQLSTDLPQTVKELVEQNKNDKETKKIQVFLDKDSIKILPGEAAPIQTDVSHLRQELEQIKKQNPEVFVMYLNPTPETSHNQVLQVMDVSRKVSNSTPDIEFTNPKTGKTERTRFLFPEVVLANSMDG